ncbi:unnamed protein product, partial [marine sediment metagenome]
AAIMWEWIWQHLVLPLLGWLGEKGCGWASEKVKNSFKNRKKVDSENGLQKEKSIETILEEEAGLQENITYNFDPSDYIDKVVKLLTIVRKHLCNESKCILVGTTTLSPSQIISGDLVLYHQIWEDHAKKCHELHKEEKYIPKRVVCSSYVSLKDDVAHFESECDAFFDWCNRTDFEVRMLFRNYKSFRKRHRIELHS